MDRNTKNRDAVRFGIVIVSCGAVGIILGGTNSQAAMTDCLAAKTVTNECLMQNPLQKQIEGMSLGMFVGVGAAVGATWQQQRGKN